MAEALGYASENSFRSMIRHNKYPRPSLKVGRFYYYTQDELSAFLDIRNASLRRFVKHFTEEQKQEIRWLYFEEAWNQREIAKRFNTRQPYISNVISATGSERIRNPGRSPTD